MSFLEELETARMQGFTRDEESGWEDTFKRAYEAMRDHILSKAAVIVRDGNFDQNDKPIELNNGKTSRHVFGLSNKTMALLAEKFKQDGLRVETYDDNGELAFRVYLPKLPEYFRVKN